MAGAKLDTHRVTLEMSNSKESNKISNLYLYFGKEETGQYYKAIPIKINKK